MSFDSTEREADRSIPLLPMCSALHKFMLVYSVLLPLSVSYS